MITEEEKQKRKEAAMSRQSKRKHIMLDEELGKQIEEYVGNISSITVFMEMACLEYMHKHPVYENPRYRYFQTNFGNDATNKENSIDAMNEKINSVYENLSKQIEDLKQLLNKN